MDKYFLFAAILVFSLSLVGCNQGDSTDSKGIAGSEGPEVTESEVVAIVNGQPITEETLTMIAQANRRANIPREKLVDDLIQYELLYWMNSVISLSVRPVVLYYST